MQTSKSRLNKHASTDEVTDEINQLKASFAQFRGDVVDMLSHSFGLGRSGTHVAKDAASDAVEELKKKIVDLKDRGVDGVEAVEKKIGDNPLHAALIAFGIGFIAAKLFSRR